MPLLALYVNRSQSGAASYINWVGEHYEHYGTFVTAAAGNSAEDGVVVSCANLRHGLCVGSLDYNAYNDPTARRVSSFSSYLNDESVEWSFVGERPHIGAAGNHSGNTSGLHMPRIDVGPGASNMMHASYEYYVPKYQPITGTSFSAPLVLSAAIQAHQYEGWFSSLYFPMVTKAVLLAATSDANADGAIGMANTWSQNETLDLDAKDGAGAINMAALQSNLENNKYFTRAMSDSDFVALHQV